MVVPSIGGRDCAFAETPGIVESEAAMAAVTAILDKSI
jgi:hypothetical protein